VEILLWLVPPAVVTVLAMLYVAWAGRDHRGEVDRDEAVRRLGKALDGRTRRSTRLPGYAVERGERDRSTGVAVRRPAPKPVEPVEPVRPEARPPAPETGEERRAS
jgi:hypothetical protein